MEKINEENYDMVQDIFDAVKIYYDGEEDFESCYNYVKSLVSGAVKKSYSQGFTDGTTSMMETAIGVIQRKNG